MPSPTIFYDSDMITSYLFFNNSIIIPVRKEELRFNLDNGRWLEEIGSIIIDNTGHQYSLSFLDDEQLFRIVDYIVELTDALNK